LSEEQAKFSIGQIVYHRIFRYRGVVLDVDPNYQNDDILYELMAQSRPPKDKPWYHLLVDGADYTTYVAEQNLEKDNSNMPITHPALNQFFGELKNGIYVLKKRMN
jgi:heat shock protein HspQ